MITRGKAALVQMSGMSGMFGLGGMLGENRVREDRTLSNGLTGDKWAKRKSRSKIAKQSRKRNRK